MGFYSSLFLPMNCGNCGADVLGEYQFRYGNIYLKEYRLGEQIDWSSEPPRKLVGVYAFLGSCSECNGSLSEVSDEYTIYIENGRFKSVGPLLEQLHQGPNYVVLDAASPTITPKLDSTLTASADDEFWLAYRQEQRLLQRPPLD